MKLSKILVAVDGSETSDYALNIAIKLGGSYSAVVDLLHVAIPTSSVLTSPPVFDPLLGTSTMVLPQPKAEPGTTSVKKDKESGLPVLLADRCKLVQAHDLPCKGIYVESNDVAGEILKTGATGAYDLTMLGSRGASGIRSFILGSTSTKVAKESKKSVLVMKTRIEGVLKILLGYDGSDESKRALDFACDLAKKFRAQAMVVGVVSIPISTEGYMVPDMDRWEVEMRNQIDSAISTLKAEGDCNAEGKVIDSPDVSRALVEEAEKGSCDLIAIGSRGRGRLRSLFLGSVASGVANSAKTNVLIVR